MDMNAEGSPLPHQAIEQERGFLRQFVFLDEELLKLINDQENSGQGRSAGDIAIAVDVLHARIAELVGAEAKLGIKALKDADSELTLALDRDDARVRQFVGRVDLEFDPLLEVDQVEVDLIGAVIQCQIRDQRVHHCRFARACAAGDQDVLRCPLAEREVLALRRAGL